MKEKLEKHNLVIGTYWLGCGTIINITRNGQLVASDVHPNDNQKELDQKCEKIVDNIIELINIAANEQV